ncbi:hypothetical protein [Salinilacihabitans rarus]|uniref:hypothetical protein n=1 Tax=Salinilacihabitans rarus TaxID=2961596 RepID=UPI0020C8BCF1|nr:hypothetical protein [Salinilacihabitans rarus]
MRRPRLNVLLAIGFLALAGGVLAAWQNPATGYEASIYSGTPTATWVGIGVAMAVALVVTIARRGRYQALGIALGATGVTAIVSLPAVRGYRFAGMGDALTHLGWARDFVEGTMLPHELFYPAVHSIASALHLAGGVSLERALLLSVVLLFVPFVVFVPLTVRDITGSASAAGFAAIASWFVLPINNVSTHMGVHTNSNALFLVPVVVFAGVAYLRRRTALERLPLGVSPFSVLVVLAGAGLLLVHPQQMINVVVLFAAISGVQFLARRRLDEHPILEQPTAYAHTALLGGLFAAWVAGNERFRRAFSGLVYGLFEGDIGGGAEVDQRGASLAEIGGSLAELFALMFLVAAVIGLIVACHVLLTWLGRTSADAETRTFVTYLGASLFPLGGIFLVYFFGTPTMAFRQVGFIYVVVTILAGVALASGFGWLSRPLTTPGSNALAAVFLGACLVLSLLTVFASPLIYTAGQHVTDQQMTGYESAFEHPREDVAYAGYGYSPERFVDGLYGVAATEDTSYVAGGEGTVAPETFERGDYSGAYGGLDYYFVVTEYDTTREHEVYRELNHDEEALEGIATDPNVDKVVSNEEFRMYAVDGAV